MNVLCAICQDLLEPSSDIFLTPCGHVFHFPCLIQWLEKVQNCPQCRQKVVRDKITRIYFNFSNTEAIKEDSVTLQQKVDSLEFKIKLKETELHNSRSENVTLKKQNHGLRDEVKKTESEINKKNSAIHALTEQSLYFKERCKEYDALYAEKLELQSRIETYDGVKKLICASAEHVDEQLSKITDMHTLTMYLSIMKRELGVCVNKRKDLRAAVKKLQQELQTLKIERNAIAEDFVKQKEELEDEIEILKSERDVLTKRINELESEIRQDTDIAAEEICKPLTEKTISRKRETDIALDIDGVSVKKAKVLEKTKLSATTKNFDDSDLVLILPNEQKTKENEENSPYLPTKSKSIFSSKARASQRSGLLITAKQNHLSAKKQDLTLNGRHNESEVVFDGFGGHSKIEVFPKPLAKKLKRSAKETAKTKKIKLDLSNSKPLLDDYVINLT